MDALLRLVASLACLASGAVHLWLYAGHRADTPELALLLAAAAAGLTLTGAALALGAATGAAAPAAAALLAGALVAYAVDRTVGLPLDAAAHAHAHAGNEADVLGLVTKGVETAGLVAATLLAGAPGARARFRPVRG